VCPLPAPSDEAKEQGNAKREDDNASTHQIDPQRVAIQTRSVVDPADSLRKAVSFACGPRPQHHDAEANEDHTGGVPRRAGFSRVYHCCSVASDML
jgi:hypothetical protein